MAKTNQDSKGKEILEDPNALVEKFKDSEVFIEKNKKVILYVLGAISVAVIAFFGYRYNQNQINENGQANMYNAVFAWEKDSLKKALNGDDGLLAIAEEYSGTDAGNLASYYAGVALLKDGKYDDAIEQLKTFSSNDLLLQGVAYSLIGDAYMEKKEFDNAVEYYIKASNYKPNESFTPRYLMKLALAQELNKDFTSAVKAYDRIIEEFPKSPSLNDAKKYKARAEGLSAPK